MGFVQRFGGGAFRFVKQNNPVGWQRVESQILHAKRKQKGTFLQQEKRWSQVQHFSFISTHLSKASGSGVYFNQNSNHSSQTFFL